MNFIKNNFRFLYFRGYLGILNISVESDLCSKEDLEKLTREDEKELFVVDFKRSIFDFFNEV